jgi:hypothetical protein
MPALIICMFKTVFWGNRRGDAVKARLAAVSILLSIQFFFCHTFFLTRVVLSFTNKKPGWLSPVPILIVLFLDEQGLGAVCHLDEFHGTQHFGTVDKIFFS